MVWDNTYLLNSLLFTLITSLFFPDYKTKLHQKFSSTQFRLQKTSFNKNIAQNVPLDSPLRYIHSLQGI